MVAKIFQAGTMAKSPTVKQVSECFIQPRFHVEKSDDPCYLAPCDLSMLSCHYIQKGLFYIKPEKICISTLLEKLKDSLASTLVHFYPLAGQLETEIDEHQHTSLIFVNCRKGPGARFIHATLDMKMADVLSPTDVPLIVQSLFDHHKALNHDGHTRPLLSIQVTELVDCLFIGCSMNHAVCDGTSYWHFWNTWSQIHRSPQTLLTKPPVHERWFPEGCGPRITLPFIHADEFIRTKKAAELRERIFSFSSAAMLKLKREANAEAGKTDTPISSFQALSAVVWKAITRARLQASCEKTFCFLAADFRHRLEPALPQEYFGNLIWPAKASATAGELLENDQGSAALSLHQAVSELQDKLVRKVFGDWVRSPSVHQVGGLYGSSSVAIGGSPRFDVYGNDFGFGKPVAVRSGYANKITGKSTAYAGNEWRGSVDLEICLPPDEMSTLEIDDEFMCFVTKA